MSNGSDRGKINLNKIYTDSSEILIGNTLNL